MDPQSCRDCFLWAGGNTNDVLMYYRVRVSCLQGRDFGGHTRTQQCTYAYIYIYIYIYTNIYFYTYTKLSHELTEDTCHAVTYVLETERRERERADLCACVNDRDDAAGYDACDGATNLKVGDVGFKQYWVVVRAWDYE